MHAWRLAQTEIDISKYDALIAVGGDGTLHEVVNGLMNRSDGKQIPIAFIPNGSGNDTCYGLGVTTVDQAIDFILKGETIKMDLNRVYMDADNEEQIQVSERTNRTRYSVINASIGYIAKVVHLGNSHKKYVGSLCYTTAGFVELAGRLRAEDFEMELDCGNGNKLTIPVLSSQIFMIMNGKFGGSHMPFSPMALMNDGLLDFMCLKGHFNHIFAALYMLN